MEKLKLNKNTKEYKQLESILNYEVLGMRAKLLQKTINETSEPINKTTYFIKRLKDNAFYNYKKEITSTKQAKNIITRYLNHYKKGVKKQW